MGKKDNLVAYKIFRGILGPIYKFWYCPKIIGSENIPQDGRFIIVGNHVHIMDQCNVIISTKRVLHYMAKKEYFDKRYKEGHHAWFFRSAGCIPVDRSRKDEEAVSAAIAVLEKDEALGLFPEGTRNGLKEERVRELYDKYMDESVDFLDFFKRIKKNKNSFISYMEELLDKKKISREEFLSNLEDANRFLEELVESGRIRKKDYYDHIFLPFKFGAVSMAKKTNSVLVPYVITGDYKFRSKNLLVRIGKPIQVSNDLEKSNQKLEDIMRKMYEENKKDSL